jgi:hypothetical protein
MCQNGKHKKQDNQKLTKSTVKCEVGAIHYAILDHDHGQGTVPQSVSKHLWIDSPGLQVQKISRKRN